MEIFKFNKNDFINMFSLNKTMQKLTLEDADIISANGYDIFYKFISDDNFFVDLFKEENNNGKHTKDKRDRNNIK